jgi:putative hydrolase of the HAD superfamily
MKFPGEINTLAFDWGGTLMLEDKRYSGAMVDWPEVLAVEGIQAALQVLQGPCRMVVVTNAVNSGAAQVQAALKRVQLDGFFTAIFTFHELQARKPELRFFRGVEKALGVTPGQVALVGDDFWADVSGACQAGWRAIWYVPSGEACPGLAPLHQGEVMRMEELPAALERLDLPDPVTCQRWCLEQEASFNLWQHMQLVGAVSYQLAAWLRAKGETVDPILAHRGGLLHDLAKISAGQINTSADHGAVAGSLLRERGQPELADIARSHEILLLGRLDGPRTWEEKLVYFADRLAEGGRLVTLAERLEAVAGRYPSLADQILGMAAPIAALQQEIARAAGIPPDRLVERLQNALIGGNG